MTLRQEAKILWDSLAVLSEARQANDETRIIAALEEIEAIRTFTDEPTIRDRCAAVLARYKVVVHQAASLALGATVSALLLAASYEFDDRLARFWGLMT